MDDQRIIALYWARDEAAIPATAEKYGGYCGSIARNIAGSPEDAEECVNDTWLAAWNAMPPHRPSVLVSFLGRLTRNLALNRRQQQWALKRGGGELPLVLEELDECVSGGETPETALDRALLAEAIETFLSALPQKQRKLFLCRYWYADPVRDIARRFGMTENSVSAALRRVRLKLREDLREKGFAV